MEDQEQQKDIKKGLKNIVRWDGWKKELFWILFFVALFFSAYSYKRDIDLCRPYIEDPCMKCAERDNATIYLLQQEIGYLKEKNKISINDLNLSVVTDGK
jgi:hypothetical protein